MAFAQTDQKRPVRFTEIVKGVSTQVRVLHALVLRESMTRYGEHKIGFLWAILEPMAMVIVFVTIFSLFKSLTADVPIALFMLTGLVPFTLFQDNKTQMQSAIASNKALLAFPQVTTFDVIFARSILETLITLSVFVVLLTIFYLFGFEFRVENPIGVLAACGLIAAMGIGVGFMLASLKPLLPSVQQLSNALLGRPLFLSSGVFFSAERIPEEWRHYLLYNPLMHCLELLRSEFFYELDSPYGSWFYASAWAASLLALGLLMHQVLRRRAVVGL